MEGFTGALAASPPFTSPAQLDSLSLQQHLGGMTMTVAAVGDAKPSHTPARPVAGHATSPWLDTPARVTDHGVPSNLRDSIGEVQDEANTFDFDNIFDSTALPYDTPTVVAGAKREPATAFPAYVEPSTPSNTAAVNGDQLTAAEDEAEEITTHEAYAMLKFADSYALITSLNLVITRDESYLRRWQALEKENRKREKAVKALASYAKEPSHHSEDGGRDQDPSSRSGDANSLEGRPARGLLSSYSEQGGPVAYAPPSDDEEELEATMARRSRKAKANSSTSNSIAPADLHLFDAERMLTIDPFVTSEGAVTDPREWAALPVHTGVAEDIKKISREHLIFSYDATSERWVLNVIGNGAIVNGEHFPRGTRDLELHHDDEIFIATVGMRFALPPADEPDDDDNAILDSVETSSKMSTSPVRRLSDAFGLDESEEEAEPELQKPTGRKPVKIKLNLRKPKKTTMREDGVDGDGRGKGGGKGKPGKGKAKEKLKDEGEPSGNSKEPMKKPEKGKKPKAAAPETATDTPHTAGDVSERTVPAPSQSAEPPKPDQASPPAAPLNLEPGSVLADLAPEQMPEKRKGPGRPPKNGLLSKRDESGVKRKQKEYQRRGLPVPELNLLLQQVREEQRAKDAAAKAQARGEPAPDMPIASIEADIKTEGDPSVYVLPSESQGREGDVFNSLERRLSSPKPPRRIKSPSPIKPMSEFNEEELKKPNMTYIYIIDEILQNIEGGQADLQTIYDKIQKRWPFYKYKVSSVGWQSSVRHNLLSCERFKDAGKSGKGKFWTINHEHPLDNKKKRPTPPPRPPPMPLPNGQMPHGLPNMLPHQYPQSGYPMPPYGPQPATGQQPYQSSYYSPYGGAHGNYGPPGSMAPPRHGSDGPYMRQTSGGPGRPPSQQPALQAPPFQAVVNAIMAFRTIWLQPHAQDVTEYARREEKFKRGTEYFSNVFHGQGAAPISDEEMNEEPYKSLKAIFDEHKSLQRAAAAAAATPATDGQVDTAVTDQQPQSAPAPTPLPQTASGTGLEKPPQGPPAIVSNTLMSGNGTTPLEAHAPVQQPQVRMNGMPQNVSDAQSMRADPGTGQAHVPQPSDGPHGSVQQAVGDAITKQAQPNAAGQHVPVVTPPGPTPPIQGAATPFEQPRQADAAGIIQTQPTAVVARPDMAPPSSNGAPLGVTQGGPEAVLPLKPATTQSSGSNQPAQAAPSAAPEPLSSAQPTGRPGQPTPGAESHVGTPRAPTPEALSGSTPSGTKRPADDNDFSTTGHDTEAKRLRTM